MRRTGPRYLAPALQLGNIVAETPALRIKHRARLAVIRCATSLKVLTIVEPSIQRRI